MKGRREGAPDAFARRPKIYSGRATRQGKKAGMTDKHETPDPGSDAAGLAEKQQMIEKLFQHTNQFLRENKHDPLLVVEALAAILVRYAALLGPVAQLSDRLAILEKLISQECAQIKELAKRADWAGKPPA